MAVDVLGMHAANVYRISEFAFLFDSFRPIEPRSFKSKKLVPSYVADVKSPC